MNQNQQFIEITAKIETGEYKLAPRKSELAYCWKSFKVVVDTDSKEIQSVSIAGSIVVRCDHCGLVKNFKQSNGTSNLNAHSLTCKKKPATTIHEFGPLTELEKTSTKKAAISYCANDLRPFDSLKGSGMISLIQHIVDLQFCRDTRINVKDLLPNPTTASRGTQEQVIQVKKSLTMLLKENVDKTHFAFGLDIWEDVSSEVKLIFRFIKFIYEY